MMDFARHFELLNGELTDASSLLFEASNRAFRYGDGLFETLKITNNSIHFFDDHFERLELGMKALKLHFSVDLNREKLRHSILNLLSKNNLQSARVRLTVYRNGKGFYLPDNNFASWHISCSPLINTNSPEGLRLGIFEEVQKAPGRYSNLKTLNALPYILASIHASEKGYDDVLILNTSHLVIETATSNFFLISGNTVYTPPLSDGSLDGVMRKNIIRKAHENGVEIIEKSLDVSDVLEADELFLTNVIRGVQWVKTFNHKTYSCDRIESIASWF